MESMPKLDDVTFIERCIAGHRADQEQLARICLPLVRKTVLLGYGNRSDAEDVTQKVLVAVFKDLKNLRNPAAFKPWLYRIAYNAIYSCGSRRSRLKALFISDSDMDTRPAAAGITPEHATMQTQLLERFSDHLARLKYKKRMAVTLSLFFGYVDSEIGNIMGCSTETAKKRVQAGRREFIRFVQNDSQLKGLIEEVAL